MQRKTLNLVQGTDAWHQHRASHLNASDAPAMMGASKYQTRSELLCEKATGLAADVSEHQQRLYDRGHEAEALIRPLIEQQIGEELYSTTMSAVVDGLALSASLDGQTMDGDVIWEHKLFSESLVAQVLAGELEPHYYWQLEHQLLVSGADHVIFTTSDGTQENEASMVYRPVPGRAEALIAGWKQFQADVAAYVPEATPAPVVATPVEGFGALTLRVEGRVLASNLDAFRADADAFIARLPKASELETDQDFADAEAAVKACGEAESRIKAAKDAALAQMADVDAVLRAADAVAETIRAARLALDKAVRAEKENRRAAIVSAGVKSVLDHYTNINATLGEYSIGAPASLSSELGAAIKGKRTISSITDAVDAAVAQAKIAASQRADAIRVNVAILQEYADWMHIIPGPVQLVHTKQPDDLRNLLSTRVAEYKRQLDQDAKEELAKQEAERIRAEEQAKAERAAKNFEGITNDADVAQPVEHLPSKQAVAGSTPAARSTIKLGQINDAIAPLSITADGLAQLGFKPVGQQRAAKLYAADDFPRICAAIARLVADAPARLELPEAA